MASKIRLKSSHRRYLLKDDKRPVQKPKVEVERVAASKTKKRGK